MTDPLVRALLAHLERGLDAGALRRDLEIALGPARTSPQPQVTAPSAAGAAEADVLARLMLSDILDDTILGARPNDKPFPLRLVLGALAEHIGSRKNERARELSLVLASALNLYFRAELDEEVRVRVGYEASRLFYSFAAAAGLDRDLVARSAPLLAALLTSQLERVRFESVDHVAVFDSQLHERDRGSDPHSARVTARASFLARVTATGTVRMKAQVRT